jgi:hypothetical protein
VDFAILILLLAGMTLLAAAVTNVSVTAIVQNFIGGK